MSDPVLQTVPLQMHWPTLDPFLFCAHHDDAYPQGDPKMGPMASLAGRELGMDFAGIDGWNMYHGEHVPGFPQHPHRGFETVTYVRKGIIDHSDSLGAMARFGRGDVQWLTAGRGIQHSEMFPLLNRESSNPLELFQIWLNLPRADKMVDPYFTMFWGDDVPKLTVGEPGRQARITVIAGGLEGSTAPEPPPDSWAHRTNSDLAIFHLALDPGASWTLPKAGSERTSRTLYAFEGSDLSVTGHEGVLPAKTGAVVRCDIPVEISSRDGVEILMLQGAPIGEPVAQQGPFVMNTQDEVRQAFSDYQRTQFGGWPWPDSAPVRDRDQARMAIHPDGRIERPER